MTIYTADLQRDNRVGALVVDALLKPATNSNGGLSVNWNFLTPTRNTLYYTFDIVHGTNSQLSTTLSAFNLHQRQAVTDIFEYAGKITGIEFLKVHSGRNADLHFANTDIPGKPYGQCQTAPPTYTTQRLPNGAEVIGEYSADAYIYLDNAEYLATNRTPAAGNSGYHVLLHEIGHALGLKHPFQAPDEPVDPDVLPSYQNTLKYTVMSYDTGGDVHPSTYGPFDLLALLWLYGGDGLAGAGGNGKTSINNDALFGTDKINDVLLGSSGNDILAGFGGNDILHGGDAQDFLMGGTGKDLYMLAENWPTTDTVVTLPGDSLVGGFDSVKNFSLAGSGAADLILLPSMRIAADGMNNGMDAATIRSHNIMNGLIDFDDSDSYAAPLPLTPALLNSVFLYLQVNIGGYDTVIFNAAGDCYLFQDQGTQDCLLRLIGVRAQGLDTHGTMPDSVWLV